MSVMIVTYDLRAPNRNYNDLYDALNEYTNCHALDSSWFIDTHKSTADVRDDLMQHLDADDQIYVMKLRKDWAAKKKETCTSWLKDQERTWD